MGGRGGGLYNVSLHRVGRWNVLWMFFPPSCLSWNIFNPNKPVFTLDAARGCHSFPDTLLKVRLNSPLINKLICKVSPEVYHSFDGCVTCPVWYGRVWKLKYLQQLPGWRLARGRSCIHIHTHILHLSSGAAQRGSRGVWVNAANQHADRPVFKVQLIIFSVYHHIIHPNTSVVLRLYNMRSGEGKKELQEGSYSQNMLIRKSNTCRF